jgi:hypothetical protein
MLVVSNAYLDPRTSLLVPPEEFFLAMRRTIDLLERLSPLSPVFKTNREVLLVARLEVQTEMMRKNVPIHQFRDSPRVRIADLSGGPGTPRFVPDTGSAASSFSAR